VFCQFFCVYWSLHTTFWSRSVPVGDCLYCGSIEFWIPIPFCISMCGVLPSPFSLFIWRSSPIVCDPSLCVVVLWFSVKHSFCSISFSRFWNRIHSQSLCFVSFSIWFNIHSVVLNPNPNSPIQCNTQCNYWCRGVVHVGSFSSSRICVDLIP